MDQIFNQPEEKKSRPMGRAFASVISEHGTGMLSLDEYLIQKPAATYFLRASNDKMSPTILPQDLMIVDRSLTPAQGMIVIATWRGEFTCKRFFQFPQHIELRSDNPHEEVIKITQEQASNFELWGVVTYVIHRTT